MFLEFYGATDTVTGSMHRLHVGEVDILLDCGLFQGHRAEANQRNREVPSWAAKSHCLVLSHAHIDHSGNIPSLVKRGFEGNVYCTPPTRDLCSVMLRDAALIQEQDARHLNKRFQREGSREHVEPIYTIDDAQQAIAQMVSLPLHRSLLIAPGVTLTFHNAGHVLGSALTLLDLEEAGRHVRLLYTGDLGRRELPLLEAPEILKNIDFLLIESTYGNRMHPTIETLDDHLAEIVNETIKRGGRVLIPSFALERAQEVLYALERLHNRKKVPRVPIYIDSPLAIAITEIYKLHPESLDTDVRLQLLNHDDPFSPPGLQYVSDVAASRRLQESSEPCIVIAGSGMCEGGRILHHLMHGLEDPRNSVVIVGFMAQHTLGRRLVEERRKVKVFGVDRDVRARVHALDGLSAHADRKDLVDFVRKVSAVGHVKRVALVHGEEEARDALGAALREQGVPQVIPATKGERIPL